MPTSDRIGKYTIRIIICPKAAEFISFEASLPTTPSILATLNFPSCRVLQPMHNRLYDDDGSINDQSKIYRSKTHEVSTHAEQIHQTHSEQKG
jgi:hypothetical protein